MNVSYRREMKHNYLIIDPDIILWARYEIGMMSSNCIEGLLKFHIKKVDDKQYYYYEITSRQPISRILDVHSISAEELGRLIYGLSHILEGIESYLLSEDQLLLEADYIYMDLENFTPYLCLIPGRQEHFSDCLTKLLQYLLGKVNHADKDCVVLAYGLYQVSLRENYGMEDLILLTARQDGQEKVHIHQSEGVAEKAEETERRAEAEFYSKESAQKKTEQEEPDQKTPDKSGHFIEERKRLSGTHGIICAAIVVVAPCLLWLLGGTYYLSRYWPVLAAMDGIIMLNLLLTNLMRGKVRNEDSQSAVNGYHDKVLGSGSEKRHGKPEYDGQTAWNMIFSEGDREDSGLRPEGQAAANDDCQTTLLTDMGEQKKCRYLHSVNGENADIMITYVPFLIGKQEGMADYVLNRDTVSRLHVKIDCEEETYYITDLNSTNGTKVKGRPLDANETAVLEAGDQVYIANIEYVFT